MDMLVAYLHKKGINYKALDISIYIIFSLILAFVVLQLLALILGGDEAMMIVVSPSMIDKLFIGDIVVLKGPNINALEIPFDGNLKNKYIEGVFQLNHSEEIISTDKGLVKKISIESLTLNDINYPVTKNGDIIVYQSDTSSRKIIHRAIFKLVADDGNFFITKGDNEETNFYFDQEKLYDGKGNSGRITNYLIPEDEVLSEYWFKIPKVGLIKIWIFDFVGSIFGR